MNVDPILRTLARKHGLDENELIIAALSEGLPSGGAAPPVQPVRARTSSSPASAVAPGVDAARRNVLAALLSDRRSGGSRAGSLAALGQFEAARNAPRQAPNRDLAKALAAGRAYQAKTSPAKSSVASGFVAPAANAPVGKGAAELLTSRGWKGTHGTDQLWEKTPTAADIMAKPGTTVGAPEDGVIIRHGSAQGGQSLYFRGKSGKVYWLGHIDSMLPVRTRVRANQPIARVSADHDAPHLHIDWKDE